jgi:hypothetical protein
MADQSREEEGAASLHDEAAARKDESNLRIAICNAYVHWQSHRDADTDRRALQRADSRLAAVENRESYFAASVMYRQR